MEGIVIIDKPSKISSFDVIRRLRKILNEKRIGHTGTLDPLATGVLVICIGRATKLAQDIENDEKEYLTEFELGYKTDTYDKEGTVVATNFIDIEKPYLESVLKQFTGDLEQIPPMYSAIKINGKKLYELARQGIEIERKPRKISIDLLNLLSFEKNIVKLECVVSKGTYIRSLIYDIGEKLGSFATMTKLRRTRVGDKKLEDGYTLDEIEKMVSKNDLSFLKSIEDSFLFTKIEIDNDKDLNLYINGQRCRKNLMDGRYRVYFKGEFKGLGEIKNRLLKGYKYY